MAEPTPPSPALRGARPAAARPAHARRADRAPAPVSGPGGTLGLGAFRTGHEALHGVAWLGAATVFPQAVGLARPGTRICCGGSARRRQRGARQARHRPDRRAQRLGARGQPAARPALGPQRGGLHRGPVADRRSWARPTPGGCAATTRRTGGPPPPSNTSWPTTTRPTAASPRPAVPPGAARIRAARLPRPDRGGRAAR